MACAAMAIASSAKARKVQIVNASWWVATDTDWSSPDVASAPSTTAYVVSSSAARSVRVRMTRATLALGRPPDAGQVGAQARRPRAGRRGRPPHSSAAALASWASTEPRAEPAMPRP